jgi:hypothetical protein
MPICNIKFASHFLNIYFKVYLRNNYKIIKYI